MKLPAKSEYAEMVRKASGRSPLAKDTVCAFLIGGAICSLGQLLRSLYVGAGLSAEDAGLLVSASLIFLGALFTALGLYDKLAKYGGAGTLVPITGFSNAVVSPALEFRTEGIITGVCAKMFTIAGPVIVFSTVSGMVYGAIYWALGSI